jgi:hypothetical protein
MLDCSLKRVGLPATQSHSSLQLESEQLRGEVRRLQALIAKSQQLHQAAQSQKAALGLADAQGGNSSTPPHLLQPLQVAGEQLRQVQIVGEELKQQLAAKEAALQGGRGPSCWWMPLAHWCHMHDAGC